MSQLCFYLPPFSSDYSGACAALFDLNCMVVINDGSCCTRNYVSFDEPRWFGNKKPIYCSGLTETDAVLGDDAKLVSKIRKALETIEEPDFIALLGSPVPSIIGTDFDGLAAEVEAATGIPSIGLDTTGLSYYNKGFAKAVCALIERFADSDTETRKGTVNVLGACPMDYSDGENVSDIKGWLAKEGWLVNATISMETNLGEIRSLGEAEVNLVVSSAGIDVARFLQKRFGTPFVCGIPFGGEDPDLARALRGDAVESPSFASGEHGGTLIVGDQIIANSMRNCLYRQTGELAVTVASFFGLDGEFACDHDVELASEEAFQLLIAKGGYGRLIGDPLLAEVPGADTMRFNRVAHAAISSNLYWHDYPRFLQPSFAEKIAEASD